MTETPQQWLQRAMTDQSACPRTLAEYELAHAEGLFERYPNWIPSDVACEMVGLPLGYGQKAEPYTYREKRRLLATMKEDAAFAREFAAIVRYAVHNVD